MTTYSAILIMPRYGWRVLLGVSAIPLVLFTIACKWLPESPRYHVLSGQPEKAMKTLEWIAKVNKKPLPRGTLTGSEKCKIHIGTIFQFSFWSCGKSRLNKRLVEESDESYNGIALDYLVFMRIFLLRNSFIDN